MQIECSGGLTIFALTFPTWPTWTQNRNKKVLLREHKRHTARRVVSTPSVVLTGYPPGRVPPILTWPGGTLPGYPPGGVPPVLTWQGSTPQQGTSHPDLAGGCTLPGYHWQGTPHPNLVRGYPTWVPPILTWPGGYPTWVPSQHCTPQPGYPPVSAPWHSGKCCKALWDMGTPPVSAPWHSGKCCKAL